MASDRVEAGAANAILFEDIFEVIALNPEGKKFDRVDRVSARSQTYEADLLIDVASEVYGLRVGEHFTLALSSTLRLDGQPDSEHYEPSTKATLLDDYEYGMHGRVFKYEHLADRRVAVVASFGGLLMMLSGEQRHLIRLHLDSAVYALLRKASKT